MSVCDTILQNSILFVLQLLNKNDVKIWYMRDVGEFYFLTHDATVTSAWEVARLAIAREPILAGFKLGSCVQTTVVMDQ